MTLRDVRIHYFHANAAAIGGVLERPFKKDIPVQSAASLSPSGGSYEASTVDFQFEKIITAKTTRSRVEGHMVGSSASTRFMSTVEGVNVLDVVRADEVVAYIATEHPGEDPDVPRVDFGATRITGLRIGDSIVTIHLDLKLLNNGNGSHFPKKPHLYDKAIWKRVGQKFDDEKRSLQCSLVEKIEVIRGKLPGKLVKPHVIEIPNFGRVHLAELLISGNSYELLMMRLELGCPVIGSATMSAGKVNGQGGGG
jgi:hypothetical protein